MLREKNARLTSFRNTACRNVNPSYLAKRNVTSATNIATAIFMTDASYGYATFIGFSLFESSENSFRSRRHVASEKWLEKERAPALQLPFILISFSRVSLHPRAELAPLRSAARREELRPSAPFCVAWARGAGSVRTLHVRYIRGSFGWEFGGVQSNVFYPVSTGIRERAREKERERERGPGWAYAGIDPRLHSRDVTVDEETGGKRGRKRRER